MDLADFWRQYPQLWSIKKPSKTGERRWSSASFLNGYQPALEVVLTDATWKYQCVPVRHFTFVDALSLDPSLSCTHIVTFSLSKTNKCQWDTTLPLMLSPWLRASSVLILSGLSYQEPTSTSERLHLR
jgi:hypothetical protein